MKNSSLFLLLSTFLFSSCGVLRSDRTVKSIEINYDKNAEINHGKEIPLKIKATYSDGKVKDVSKKNGLELNVAGGIYQNGNLRIDPYPTNFNQNTVLIKATYSVDEQTFEANKTIPLNYKGDLLLDFSGKDGLSGKNGKSRNNPLFVMDGKDGENGEDGTDGISGNQLVVNIWKNGNEPLYYIKVLDMLNPTLTYYYKLSDHGNKLRLHSKGGNGGNGGAGGNGSDGKDGKTTADKTKLPGNGGNGGNGANGGNGGDGGVIYIYIHPNAKSVKSLIETLNTGGTQGNAGPLGKAGKAGVPGNSQSEKKAGEPGKEGNAGFNGQNGPTPIQMIEEFDLEH